MITLCKLVDRETDKILFHSSLDSIAKTLIQLNGGDTVIVSGVKYFIYEKMVIVENCILTIDIYVTVFDVED